MHQKLLIALIGLIMTGTVLTLLQIWTSWISWDFYLKAGGTILILLLVISLIMVINSDFGSKKDLKDKNYLD